MAVSEFSKQQIKEVFGVSDSDITVVHPAVAESYRMPRSEAELKAVRKHYGLPDKFVLSVGTLEPRKNLSGLIRAFERLPDALQAEFPLVFVGGKGLAF